MTNIKRLELIKKLKWELADIDHTLVYDDEFGSAKGYVIKLGIYKGSVNYPTVSELETTLVYVDRDGSLTACDKHQQRIVDTWLKHLYAQAMLFKAKAKANDK